MNIRSRAEREILKNLDSMSLSEVFLVSLGSRAETNMVLMKLISRLHCLHVIRNKSESYQVRKISAAA